MGKQIKTLSEAVAIRLSQHRQAAGEARQRGEESMRQHRHRGGTARGRMNTAGSNTVAGRVDVTADDGAVAGGRRSTPALGIRRDGGGIGRGAMDSSPRPGYRTRGPK